MGHEAFLRQGYTLTPGVEYFEKREPLRPADLDALGRHGRPPDRGHGLGRAGRDGRHQGAHRAADRAAAGRAGPRRAPRRRPAQGGGALRASRARARPPSPRPWPAASGGPSSSSSPAASRPRAPTGAPGRCATSSRRPTTSSTWSLFIDEVDEIAGAPGGSGRTPRASTNELLKAIPAFRARDDRLLVCATNSVRDLDPALLRPGRFDYVLPIGPPDDARPRRALAAASWPASRPSGCTVDELVASTELFTPGRRRVRRAQGRPGGLRARPRRRAPTRRPTTRTSGPPWPRPAPPSPARWCASSRRTSTATRACERRRPGRPDGRGAARPQRRLLGRRAGGPFARAVGRVSPSRAGVAHRLRLRLAADLPAGGAAGRGRRHRAGVPGRVGGRGGGGARRRRRADGVAGAAGGLRRRLRRRPPHVRHRALGGHAARAPLRLGGRPRRAGALGPGAAGAARRRADRGGAVRAGRAQRHHVLRRHAPLPAAALRRRRGAGRGAVGRLPDRHRLLRRPPLRQHPHARCSCRWGSRSPSPA